MPADVLNAILTYGTTDDQIRSLITLSDPLQDFQNGDRSSDVFRRMYQSAQCMEFFFDSISTAYHDLLSRYT